MGASTSQRRFRPVRLVPEAKLQPMNRRKIKRAPAARHRAMARPSTKTLAVALLCAGAVCFAGHSASRLMASSAIAMTPGFLGEVYMCRETAEPLAFAEARVAPFEHEGKMYWEAMVCAAENCPGSVDGGVSAPFPGIQIRQRAGRVVTGCPLCMKARLGYGEVERYWPPIHMSL